MSPAGRRRLVTAAHGTAVLIGAALVVILTHDFGYLATWPLWGDEAWVALSRLFPLTDLPSLTSSTPIGFNLLGWLFTADSWQGGRLLVQAFNVLAIVAAYTVGFVINVHGGRVARVAAGIAAGAAVALAPATLIRVDYKHYTADAFFAILLLLLVVLARRRVRGPALVALTVTTSLGLLFSFSVLFCGAAAYLVLLVEQVIQRRWRRARRVVVHGAIAGASMVAIYLTTYSRGDNSALRDFWLWQYPTDVFDVPSFVASRLATIDEFFVFPSAWFLVPAILIGIGIPLVRRQWAIALFLPAAFLVQTTVAVLHRYPLLDVRTSHYLVILGSLVAMLGWLELITVLVAYFRRRQRWSKFVSGAAFVAAAAALCGLVFGLNRPLIGSHPLPNYDTTHQVAYVEEHFRSGDLVLFNQLASYQLALDWTWDEPDWCPSELAWTGYDICFPDSTTIAPFYSLDEAYDLIDEHLEAHPGSRVWLIRSHVFVEYEQMEKDLPERYDYEVIPLPIQPVGLVSGFATTDPETR